MDSGARVYGVVVIGDAWGIFIGGIFIWCRAHFSNGLSLSWEKRLAGGCDIP